MKKIKEFIKEEYKFLIFMFVIIVVSYVKLPYYIETSGGTINLTDRIELSGYDNKEGSLNMLYVSEYKATPVSYLFAKIRGMEIIPASSKKVSNESIEEAEKRYKIMRDNSLDIATMIAYDRAGKDIKIKNKKNVVLATTSDAPIKVGDVILKVDNNTYENSDDIRKYIQTKDIGENINFKVLRDNKEINLDVKVNEEEGRKVIGIVIVTDFDFELNPSITLKFRNSESGSSGGMMLTLTIYNAISGEDIIKGRDIAGTGTINLDGSIGEIAGVNYKIMGAAKNNIDLVLVPSSNYKEAIETKKKYKYDMDIVKVDTIDEAINYLKNSK